MRRSLLFKSLTGEQAQREAWRQAIQAPADGKTGCFKAPYPSAVWQATPCVKAPDHPMGPPPDTVRPLLVGSVNGDYTANSSGFLVSATGALAEVDNLTTETGTQNKVPNLLNLWSLQLNSNTFSSVACIVSTTTGCQGWAQFVFSNDGNVFIQNWILNFESPSVCEPSEHGRALAASAEGFAPRTRKTTADSACAGLPAVSRSRRNVRDGEREAGLQRDTAVGRCKCAPPGRAAATSVSAMP